MKPLKLKWYIILTVLFHIRSDKMIIKKYRPDQLHISSEVKSQVVIN